MTNEEMILKLEAMYKEASENKDYKRLEMAERSIKILKLGGQLARRFRRDFERRTSNSVKRIHDVRSRD